MKAKKTTKTPALPTPPSLDATLRALINEWGVGSVLEALAAEVRAHADRGIDKSHVGGPAAIERALVDSDRMYECAKEIDAAASNLCRMR